MINYTERITRLMQDVVARTPALGFIDLREVLVFGRFGRPESEGAFATCHCLTLPESEPGYYFWRDRDTGELTRRSEWFVTKTPEVRRHGTRIKYLISFVLPRFCEQTLERSWKADLYGPVEPWVAKLDTIVHELYHIDPAATGIRQVMNADGTRARGTHAPEFYDNVAAMTKQYLASNPDPSLYEFLGYDFTELHRRYGGVAATTFRNFPSFPQRYMERCATLPVETGAGVKIEPLKRPGQPPLYTERDLHVRQFTGATARRITGSVSLQQSA
ncbi:MAG TPA: hypothetical protein VFK57_20505 [Vicinamibacterales bacterium]|nr:hypothetical protein [Vicinamibacterales bacterium]